jgi:hypothetical protein
MFVLPIALHEPDAQVTDRPASLQSDEYSFAPVLASELLRSKTRRRFVERALQDRPDA